MMGVAEAEAEAVVVDAEIDVVDINEVDVADAEHVSGAVSFTKKVEKSSSKRVVMLTVLGSVVFKSTKRAIGQLSICSCAVELFFFGTPGK